MGTEAAWVPLVLAAVSTAATVYETKATARRQDNALAAQIEASSRKERQADDRVRQLVDQTTQSTPEGERTQALNQYIAALNASGGTATQGLTGPKGAASDRYTKEAQDAALGVSKYGADRAGLFATIDAATRQRQREGFGINRAQADISGIMGEAARQDFINSLRTQNAGIRNPYVDAFAGLAGGAAKGYASGASTGVGGVTRNTFTTNPNVDLTGVGSSLFYNGGGR